MELYKYIPAENFEKYIINGPTIRFTPSSEFNDPFEFYSAVAKYRDEKRWEKFSEKVVQEEIEKRLIVFPKKERSKIRKILMAKKGHIVHAALKDSISMVQDKEYYDRMYKDIGVFCVTIDCSNILMWSHYASNHNGVAISFDSDDNFFKKNTSPTREVS